MAELLLNALLPMLFERLTSPALLNLASREKIGDVVKKWDTKLKTISKLLEDAEDKVISGDQTVQLWLDDLRDLVYDIEDLVDEFVTEEGIRGITGKVRSLLPSCSADMSPQKLDHELRSRMEKIDDRLDSIFEQKKDLELNESDASTITKINHSHVRMTTSLPVSNVLGRKEDEIAILAKLLAETEDLSVIPIVGNRGLGKTTLAKSVFNHTTVVEAFPIRGWVCGSNNLNKLAIARAVLRSLDGVSCGIDYDLIVYYKKIGEILSKKKFLIVLDDYCNNNYSDWDELHNLFNLGPKGSKVIVTTRDEGVASVMTNHPTFRLGKLSDGDCLSLLAYHAFGASNFDAHTHLKKIGEAIVLKCAGLPLAAKALGGLFRYKPKIATEWEDIRDSKIWTFESSKDDILFLALKLSYIHLPSHLKRCFIFCAIFPKDHEFDRDELVLLWMAEGLVEMKFKNVQSCMLDQGRKQFDELLSRSFFQRSAQNESLFVMHDLMHGLAVSIGGNTCFNVEANEIEDVNYKSPEKVRHFLYSSISTGMDAKFEKCYILKRLRTFIASPREIRAYVSDKALEEFLQSLKYLRALSLRRYCVKKIPNCIGHLKHLRYLNFSGNSRLKELPESICTLYNLETLILNGCSELTELPPGMGKLVNLKCLDIKDTPKLKNMPVELSHMHNFEILTKFIVGREDGLKLKVLRKLQHLQGEISIMNLRNVEDVGDARDAGLSSKVGLTTLALQWGWRFNSVNADKEKQVFEFLKPHRNIKEVEIHGYEGISFPLWIGSPSMANMTKVRLGLCGKVTILPSFGVLPCLRELEIKRMNAVFSVGSEFYGNVERPFPCLEVLKFIDMLSWEVWSFSCGEKEIEGPLRLVSKMPHRLCSLVKLKIYECPLLKASPCIAHLSSLEDLDIKGCNHNLLAMISSASSYALVRISLDCIQKLTYLNEDTLNAVERLEIRNCNELIGLWDDNALVTSLTRLKYLSINECANLQKLPNNMQRLTSLKQVRIENCSKLESFSEEIMNCNLEWLLISGCEKLEILPEGTIINNDGPNGASCSASNSAVLLDDLYIGRCSIQNIPCFVSMFNNLTELSLIDCPFLEADLFPKLPSCLKSLRISGCEKIKYLPHQMHKTLTSLQFLEIWELSIESFPEGGLPLSIEELEVGDCPRLKQPLEEWGLHRLPALKRLVIWGEIGSLFLEEGIITCFPSLPSDWLFFPSKLEILEIWYQPDMVRLSNGLRDNLTSLRELRLSECPNLRFLPEEGFPLSLEYLDISNCSQHHIESKWSKNGEYFPFIRSIPNFSFAWL